LVDLELILDIMGIRDISNAEILQYISDAERYRDLSDEKDKKIEAITYEYQSMRVKCNQVNSEKIKVEKEYVSLKTSAEISLQKARLELMLENVELKSRLYDLLIERMEENRKGLRVLNRIS